MQVNCHFYRLTYCPGLMKGWFNEEGLQGQQTKFSVCSWKLCTFIAIKVIVVRVLENRNC